MPPLSAEWARRTALVALLALGCGVAARADEKPAYRLPLAAATEWQALVFAARTPAALSDQPVAYTLKVTWQAGGQAGSRELAGKVALLQTDHLVFQLPAGCASFAAVLDWTAPGSDLDLGLECPSLHLHLAPTLTVLKPERVRLDAQTAPFYEWLAARHPDWWRGYPFWAEVEPAPKAQ